VSLCGLPSDELGMTDQGLNRSTIRKFVVASQFIEVLRSFEAPFGMREEVSLLDRVNRRCGMTAE
jgi:hypothetical protein